MVNYSVPYTIGAPLKLDMTPRISVDALGAYVPEQYTDYTGEKYHGGFGLTKIFSTDYWMLRKRSEQLFNENLYAKGLIRRLITNEINTGLTPECIPDESILKISSDELSPWTENVEARFDMWAKNPQICDYYGESTFGELQQMARREALICGDVLAVVYQSRKTGMPQLQLIPGSRVRTPMESPRSGNIIKHGVEMDAQGRVVAYWIQQDDGNAKRMPAWGEKSGRRIAWLVFGVEKRLDEVRGQPLLSVVLQSLKEIDRYRDSAQRKATINSILAMFIKKTQDKPSTLPITGGAIRKGSVQNGAASEPERRLNFSKHLPGTIFQELQVGEEPVVHSTQGADVNFATFEAAIINAVAWANEIPPEILTLGFSSNYSASQAAINEFKSYLNRVWAKWGDQFCAPIYNEWFISEVLLQRIQAEGFIESWGDPQKYDVFGAWTNVTWFGSIKPSTDTLKQARGEQVMVQYGWSTHARASRMLTGTKWRNNIRWLKKENEAIANTLRPLLDLSREYNVPLPVIQALAGKMGLEASVKDFKDDENESAKLDA